MQHIKHLKTLMRSSRDEGLNNNQEIDRKKFKVIGVNVKNIYLTESELSRINKLDLSDKPALELARDVFMIGCYTAQRFSDYSRIKKDNLRTLQKGIRVIDIIQQKTGERVIIPIRNELESILMKYDYTVPKIYEQKLNINIKDICKMAGINEVIMIEDVRGGLKIEKKIPKYNLVKTHTARRSGCTNMYLAGIQLLDIMKISGHKTPKEFLNYIKVGKEETALNLAKHPYFKGKLRVI